MPTFVTAAMYNFMSTGEIFNSTQLARSSGMVQSFVPVPEYVTPRMETVYKLQNELERTKKELQAAKVRLGEEPNDLLRPALQGLESRAGRKFRLEEGENERSNSGGAAAVGDGG